MGDARMAAGHHLLQEFVPLRIEGEENRVDARNHHFLDSRLAQFLDALDHLALVGVTLGGAIDIGRIQGVGDRTPRVEERFEESCHTMESPLREALVARRSRMISSWRRSMGRE